MLFASLFLVGFLGASIAQKDGTDCDGTLEATPIPQGLNERTPGDRGCQARIISPIGTSIKVTISESNCVLDSKELQVYFPGDTRSKLDLCLAIDGLFGAQWPLPLELVTGNELFLYENNEDLTFHLEYSYVPQVDNICNMASPLKVGPIPKKITSPNFGFGPYFTNELCAVTIERTPECQIRLESNSSIESGYDWIRVCPDVPVDDPGCTQFGTEQFTNDTFLAVNDTTVIFKSDISGSWFGFEMELSCVSVFSEWSEWSAAGCKYSKIHKGVIFSREERHRDCLIEPCNDEDLQETRLHLCFERCRRKCCNGHRISY